MKKVNFKTLKCAGGGENPRRSWLAAAAAKPTVEWRCRRRHWSEKDTPREDRQTLTIFLVKRVQTCSSKALSNLVSITMLPFLAPSLDPASIRLAFHRIARTHAINTSINGSAPPQGGLFVLPIIIVTGCLPE